MLTNLTQYSCYITMLGSCICGLWKFRKLEVALKLITILVGLAFLTECLAYFFAFKYRNNLAVYNTSAIIQFLLVCSYFNCIVKRFKQVHLGLIIAFVGLVVAIVNMVFFQPANTLNSHFLMIDGLVTIAMSLYMYSEILRADDREAYSFQRDPHFWITTSLVIFSGTTFLSWGLYDYILNNFEQKIWIIHFILQVINLFSYGLIGKALLDASKNRK